MARKGRWANGTVAVLPFTQLNATKPLDLSLNTVSYTQSCCDTVVTAFLQKQYLCIPTGKLALVTLNPCGRSCLSPLAHELTNQNLLLFYYVTITN